MNMLAAMSWGQWFLGFVLMSTCLLLVLVILLQRGRGGGLAGAFGGSGGSSAFGAKTGDVFTWITVVVATVFVLLSVVTNFVYDESGEARATAPEVEVVPVTQPTPAAPGDLEPVTLEMVPQGEVGAQPADPAVVQPKVTPIQESDLPPEIKKKIEEEQKKQAQPAPTGAAPAPAPGTAAPATPPTGEKKPEGAATP